MLIMDFKMKNQQTIVVFRVMIFKKRLKIQTQYLPKSSRRSNNVIKALKHHRRVQEEGLKQTMLRSSD